MKQYNIGVIAGDGTGPEVIREGVKVLKAAAKLHGFGLKFTDYDFGGEATVVESYISYLRRKIDTTEPRLLHTVRGVGYVLRLPRGQ